MDFFGKLNARLQYHHLDRLENWLKKRLWLGVAFIVTSQFFFLVVSSFMPVYLGQARRDASGFSPKRAQHFLYHYYYQDLFPVVSLTEDKEYSLEAADRLLHDHPEQVVMEYEHWSRLGENARIWAYLPNAWLKGSPENPSISLFNFLLMTSSLLICFLGFAKADRLKIGAALVLVVIVTPFFLYETYGRDNVFSYPAALLLVTLGLNAKTYFQGPLSRLGWVIPLICGLLIGFYSEMRNEVTIVLGSAILLYIFSRHLIWWKRIGAIILVVVAFYSTKSMIKSHFDDKWEEAYLEVESAGGHVYNGPRIEGHRFWHPVYCGLGDFGQSKGYSWSDTVAYAWATPVLNSVYGMDLKYTSGYGLDNYYDQAKMYYVKHDDIDAYEEVVKQKVLRDISDDPKWYVGILFKRVLRIFTDTIPFPGAGWITLGLFFVFLVSNRREEFFLILIAAPLSLTSLIIYSGRHSTYNSMFPVIGMALLLLFLLNWYLGRRFSETESGTETE